METKVHGHDVMQMMLESDESYTHDSLRAAIHARFGEDARFFTCSASGMTADELIQFLQQRGKFVPTESGFQTHADKICKH